MQQQTKQQQQEQQQQQQQKKKRKKRAARARTGRETGDARAHLHLPPAVDQEVRRLHVAVDHVQVPVEIQQAEEDLRGEIDSGKTSASKEGRERAEEERVWRTKVTYLHGRVGLFVVCVF